MSGLSRVCRCFRRVWRRCSLLHENLRERRNRWLRRWGRRIARGLRAPDRWEDARRYRRWQIRMTLIAVTLVVSGIVVAIQIFPTHSRLVARYERAFATAMRTEDWATAKLCAERLLRLEPLENEHRYWLQWLRGRESGGATTVRAMRELTSDPAKAPREVYRWLVEASIEEPDLILDDVSTFDDAIVRWRDEVREALVRDSNSSHLLSLQAMGDWVSADDIDGAEARLAALAAHDGRFLLHLCALARLKGDKNLSRSFALQRFSTLQLEAPDSEVIAGREAGIEGAICLLLADELDWADDWIARYEKNWSDDTRTQVRATLYQHRAQRCLDSNDPTNLLMAGRALIDAWSLRTERQSLVRQTELWLRLAKENFTGEQLELSLDRSFASERERASTALMMGLLEWEFENEPAAMNAWSSGAAEDWGLVLLNNFAWWTLANGTREQSRAQRMLDAAIEVAESKGLKAYRASLLETRSRLLGAQGRQIEAEQELRSSRLLRETR